MAGRSGGGYTRGMSDSTLPLQRLDARHDEGRARRWALAALLTGALAIAFAPIFVRLSEAGPTATAFWRVALSSPVFLVWLWSERKGQGSRKPSTAADYWQLFLPGLFLAGDLAIWHFSVRYTSVTNATLLANFAPVVVAPVAWLLFGERITRSFVAGMLMALTGAVILMGDSLRFSADHLLGDGLGLLSAVFYAGYILSVGHLRNGFSTATIMCWSGVVTAVLLLPMVMLLGEQLLPVSIDGWLVVLGLAMISHVAGQSLITHSLAHLPASFSSVSLLLQPAGAAILAWVLLAEPLGPLQAVGAAVILGGILLARNGSR